MTEKYANKITTPAYIFDSSVLKKRIGFLKEALPPNVSLVYAVKANPFIVSAISDDVDGFEVCSEGEAEICRIQNVDSRKMILSGVNKSQEYFETLFSNKINIGRYTVESEKQYVMIKSLCRKHEIGARLLLRLTSGNQFGMNEDEIKKIIADNDQYISITGIQYFTGTQKTSVKKLTKEIEYLSSFLEQLKSEMEYKCEEIEYGGGFPVSYFDGEEFDEGTYLNEFSEMINRTFPDTRIKLELGRSIAASCGEYITAVVDTKKNKNGNFAIVDGGINHLVYYGQMMAMKRPVLSIIQEKETENKEYWTICGSLCTVNDILCKQIPISGLRCGDKIIFHNAGAYCMTEGISLFLSRSLPAVYMRETDGSLTQQRSNQETFIFNTGR